ncbi:MAG: hypothetical protein ACHQNV_06390 [Vicinamibacteria bacterium]
MRRGWAWLLGGALLALGASAVRAADDDLSIVKKAVQADAGGSGSTEAKVATPAPRKGPEPRWFRVRIVDKGEKKSKVSINLPLALVKAMGDDLPLDWGHCRKDGSAGRRTLRLSELLATLESGQEFVQIDDDEATVRIYVE